MDDDSTGCGMVFAWIIGIGVAIFLTIKFWQIVIPILVGVILLHVAIRAKNERDAKAEKAKNERDAEKAAEATRREEYLAEQKWIQEEMERLANSATEYFELLPRHLSNAQRALDQAERDFTEGAFAPFWDSIETSANMLGRFDNDILYIKMQSDNFTELVSKCAGASPLCFPVASNAVSKLTVGSTIAQRMQVIVRTAQRNFQFASIYEQRKTNQLLVSGFTNLAQALGQMTSQIISSIETLTDSIATMSSTIDNSIGAVHSQQAEILEATIESRRESSVQAKEQAMRADRALKMLDNIQRGIRPSS